MLSSQHAWICLPGLALAILGATLSPLLGAAAPRAYCAKIVNDDTLRSAPPELAAAIKHLFGLSGADALATTNYRCAGGKVLLCTIDANLPCGKANLSRRLPGATAWCRSHPNDNFIPMAVTGHDTIYSWRCAGGVAQPGRPLVQVDARGFMAEYWKPLK